MKVLSENLTAAFAFFAPSEPTQSARSRSESSGAAASSATALSSKSSEDKLEISAAAEARLAAEDEETNRREDHDASATAAPLDSAATGAEGSPQSGKTDASPTGDLSEEEQEVVDELKATDREVRTHEQAHLAAAGPYAKGGPTYSYEKGPDGQQYAVGGEVAIDTAPVSGDPEATLAKARIIRAAALAPAEPSAQDRAVASAATKMEAQAAQELREQQNDEATEDEVEGASVPLHSKTQRYYQPSRSESRR